MSNMSNRTAHADAAGEPLKYVARYADRHGKQRCYYRRNNVRIPLPSDTSSPEFAAAYAAAANGNWPAPQKRSARRRERFHRCVQRILASTKGRAASKGKAFEITPEWMFAELDRLKYRCQLTGLPFCAERSSDTLRHPYAPSLDRIDNAGGYTIDNVRLVLASVNIAINEWGEDHFAVIARAYVVNAGR